MKFSVIIPVYNRPEPVRTAIQSILNQSYADWECIVVDDASTDYTPEVCRRFADTDPRITVISNPTNSGVSASRNNGLAHTAGDYYLFLDSDDQMQPHAMQKLAETLSENDVDMVAFAVNQWWIPPAEHCNRVLDRAFIRAHILPQHINVQPHTDLFLQPYVWNKCYRSGLITDHAICFNKWQRTWEDNVFLIKCMDQCRTMLILPDRLYVQGHDPKLNHLTQLLDPSVILDYVREYHKNAALYGDEYAFDNSYTPRKYFDVIHPRLIQLAGSCSRGDFQKLLNDLTEDGAMREWCLKICPQSEEEARAQQGFADSDPRALFRVYYAQFRKKRLNETLALCHKTAVKMLRSVIGTKQFEHIKRTLR